MKHILSLLITLLLMAGCGRPAETTLSAELQRAEDLMYPHPDSALHILQGMTPPVDELNRATWALLLTQAKYKCFVDQSDSLVNIAHDYFMKGDDAQRKALTLFCKAALYEEQNKSEEALLFYQEAIKCFDGCHDYRLGYIIHARTAFIYAYRDLYDYAIDYMGKANEYALLSKDPYYIGSSYNGMARLSSGKKNYIKALEYYNKAIEIGNSYNEKIIANNALSEKVHILTRQKKYKEALINAKILRNTSNTQETQKQYLILGHLYSELAQVDSAYFYLNKASLSENIYTQRTAFQALFNLSKRIKDYENNSIYTVKLWNVQDSINKIDRNKALIEMQEKYDQQRVKDEMTAKMTLQKQRILMGIGVVVLILCFIAYRIRIRNKERITRLVEAEERIETLNHLLEEAQKEPSPDAGQDDTFFKRILLQQLGIIRMVANTPTAQNQALLRRLAETGNDEMPAEELIAWKDLYPIIDRLYDNFYTRLMERFGSVLTDKEVQTCCLLCAGFSTKEIAVITRQAVATVYIRKSTSRQKMNAPEGADIVEWVKKG